MMSMTHHYHNSKYSQSITFTCIKEHTLMAPYYKIIALYQLTYIKFGTPTRSLLKLDPLLLHL